MVAVEGLAVLCFILTVELPAGLPRKLADVVNWEYARIMLIPTLLMRAAGSTAVIAVILALGRQSLRSVGLTRRGFVLNVPIGIGSMAVAFLLLASAAVFGILLFRRVRAAVPASRDPSEGEQCRT